MLAVTTHSQDVYCNQSICLSLFLLQRTQIVLLMTVVHYSFSVSHVKYLSIIFCFHFSVNSHLNCYSYTSLFLLPCSHHLLFLLWTLRAAVGLYSTFKALHPLYSSKYTVGEQDSRLFSTLILGGYIRSPTVDYNCIERRTISTV